MGHRINEALLRGIDQPFFRRTLVKQFAAFFGFLLLLVNYSMPASALLFDLEHQVYGSISRDWIEDQDGRLVGDYNYRSIHEFEAFQTDHMVHMLTQTDIEPVRDNPELMSFQIIKGYTEFNLSSLKAREIKAVQINRVEFLADYTTYGASSFFAMNDHEDGKIAKDQFDGNVSLLHFGNDETVPSSIDVTDAFLADYKNGNNWSGYVLWGGGNGISSTKLRIHYKQNRADAPVPEPASMALTSLGLIGLFGFRKLTSLFRT
jgi:hypothetical protein